MRIGTICRNHYASDGNPTSYFIFAGTKGKYATGITYYNGRLHKETYYAKDFKDGNAMEPVGYCEAFDIMKNDLIKILEELE